MSQALFTDLLRSIKNTKARFFSIVAIVALGISFFAGMKVTQPDMFATADKYFRESNLMDISVLSTAGLTENDLYNIRLIPGISAVMPVKFVDGLLVVDGEGVVDIDGSAFTCRMISTDFNMDPQDANFMNRLQLTSGRMPEAPNECVVDASALSTPDEFVLGATFSLKGDRENLSDSLTNLDFEIVGIIRSPNYISFERGNTLIGSGKLGTFAYLPEEAFKRSYYSQVYLKLDASDDFALYSTEYDDYVDSVLRQIQDISQERLAWRVKTLREEIEPKVESGKEELKKKEAEAKTALEAARKRAEEVKYAAANGDRLIAEAEAKFTGSLSAVQQQLLAGQTEYNQNLAEFYSKQAQLQAGLAEKAKNPDAEQRYYEAQKKLEEGLKTLQDGEKRIADTEAMLNQAEGLISMVTGSSPIDMMMGQLKNLGLDTSLMEQFQKLSAVTVAEEFILGALPILSNSRATLVEEKARLADGWKEYNEGLAEWKASAGKIAQLKQLDGAEAMLQDAQMQLMQGRSDIETGSLKLEQNQIKLQIELDKQRADLEKAKAAAPTVDAQLLAAEANVNAQLEAARADIAYGERQLENLKSAQWMVTGRSSLSGYNTYHQNAQNVAALGTILPMVFFAVAAMVCLTTMSRMVEEERTQMGTLKALGYSSKIIAVKYIIYALLASLIGAVFGLAIGFTALPIAVTAAFGIMFDMPSVTLQFHIGYALIGTLIAIASTVIAAMFGCRKELITEPAQLMRPKAPKVGKRVLLERISFIWTRLSFSMKVTVRNLFRNKRRLVMTVVGIAGCTALLLASFGLGDSISAIIGYQYGENGISNFDVQLILKNAQDPDKTSDVIEQIKRDKRMGDVMLTCMKVLNGSSEENKDNLTEINVLVPQNNEKLSEFVRLQNRVTGDTPTLDDSGALITERFASNCGVEVGDQIFIRKTDGTDVIVSVAGIVENYTFHYVYMSRALYENTFGEEATFSSAYAKLSDEVKAQSGDSLSKTKGALAIDIMQLNTLNAVVYTTQIIDTFDTIIGALGMVIMVFIGAASALALVVLYNLSNININERIREIATIKVLGFYDKEVSSYMYRETIFLTIFGIGIGVFLGSFLHKIISSVVDITVVMLGQEAEWTSYLYAVLLTIALTVLVNLMMHRKLRTVDMVESLKSVE